MLPVLTLPNPLLLEKVRLCNLNDYSLRWLSNEMLQIMYDSGGIGLVGPQVGILKRIIVVDVEYILNNKNEPIVLINPRIVKASKDKIRDYESCVSCPNISALVERHKKITVEYYDLYGNKCTLMAKDLMAWCLQHEIDHLDGKTIFQVADKNTRVSLLNNYIKSNKQI